MKRKLAALSRRYLAALQKYVQAADEAELAMAHRLGQEAVALGLPSHPARPDAMKQNARPAWSPFCPGRTGTRR